MGNLAQIILTKFYFYNINFTLYKRDLSNGFIVAEILSRYFPNKLEMSCFSTGISEAEKKSNWNYLKRIFQSYDSIPLKEETIEKIINMAPNAGFDFLLTIYKFLTKKEPIIIKKINENNNLRQYDPFIPKFMRPNAIYLIRDNEIQRIKDNVTRNNIIMDTLKKHKDYLQSERLQFIKIKPLYIAEKKRKLKNRKIENSRTESRNGKSNNMQNQIGNGSSNNNDALDKSEGNMINTNFDSGTGKGEKKEEKLNMMNLINDVGKTLNEYNIENEFKDIIKKNFVEVDHNIELELKKYHDENDLINFFFEKINLCNDEKLGKVFQVYYEKTNRFIDIISKTLIEIVNILKLINRLLEILISRPLHLEIFLNATLKICEGVLSKDPLKCENIFIGYGLDILLEHMKAKPFYRNIICQIIFGLISNNRFSYYKVIQIIKKKFIIIDELLFYHIIVKCMEYTTEENIDENIIEFYDNVCMTGINSHCDIIKAKTIYLIILFMKYHPFDSLKYSDLIFKHTKSWNWEILSLVLIYCSRILSFYNTLKEEKSRIQNSQNSISEGNSNIKTDQQLLNDLVDINDKLKEVEKFEQRLLDVIDFIFQEKSPNMTIKIGFIYLAEILHYYPLLAQKYIKLLIEFKYNSVRKEVLEIENAGN